MLSQTIGFNIIICPNCEAFYCGKYSQAIIELESMRWACDALIDESKSVKQFKKEEGIEIEVSDKTQKK